MRTIEEIQAWHREIEAIDVPETMGASLDRAAERFGGREAFNYFELGERLTYQDLKDQADRAANALAAIGVRKGSHVAIMLPNIPAYPIAWFALAKLGAVMVPVNNRYTARELKYVVEDSEAEFLLIHSDYYPVLDDVADPPRMITADRTITAGRKRSDCPHHWPDVVDSASADFSPTDTVDPDDLLNIQYTSGTTGFPKGCMLTHRYWTLTGHVATHMAGFTITRILCPQFFYYLDPQFLLSMALYQGAALYVANQLRATKFMAWVREYGIDFILLFEPIFKQPEHPDDGSNNLRLACLFGLTPENHAPLEARFKTKAREWFGMTEIGGGLYMPLDYDHMVGTGSCGLPAPYREVTIRRPADGTPVGPGETGELWVRGPGIMLGYYNKPEANAESFRDGWFRTGDLFRQDEDGFYYIVGRLKDMIRRSEENIAAREVEAVLRTHRDIREAAVVPVPDEYRGEEVKAYIQLMSGKTPANVTPEAIYRHCEANLARFKVPRYIAYRDGFAYGPADRVEKYKLIAETDDLRKDSYDRVDGIWR